MMSSCAFIFQAVNHADHWNIELEHKNNDNDNNNDTNKSRILPKSRFLLTGKEIALYFYKLEYPAHGKNRGPMQLT